MLRKFGVGALVVVALSVGAGAQDAKTLIANTSRAMGADNLTSLTYSGSAQNGNFGQSRNIAGPLQMTAITTYTRSIDLNQPASRAFGPTMPPTIAGAPAPSRATSTEHHAHHDGWMDAATADLGDALGISEGRAANNATVKAERWAGRSTTW
jgi:hypothetical protein